MGSVPNDETSTEDERVTVLTFDLEEQRYCVRAKSVASVLGVADDAPLDDAADPWNAGTLTVAGEQVTVVDLPRAFGSTFRTATRVDEPRLLVFAVTDETDHYYSWLVDHVDATETVRTASLKPPRVNATHINGRFEIDGTEVVWLDERTIHG
ncbi:chemotaxis protein CheW [Natrinema zhouii]|uniref:Chemotaxis protein CheW n=1 Tax=Natrinema zhouii TaxID=1710539 RepID=A0A7D6CPI5_9EURY|nr:chemotaxis protein CheW [Natrinema zhouii]QLK25469.1 chemotaxis protein CheW [Natrinema zhouii]